MNIFLKNSSNILKKCDFDGAIVQKCRWDIKNNMLAYNAIFWDWDHLEQYYLYMALIEQLSKEKFAKFYWKTMKVALLTYKDK